MRLFNDSEYKNCKSRGELPFSCNRCDTKFFVSKKRIQDTMRKLGTEPKYCSHSCQMSDPVLRVSTTCGNCGKDINIKLSATKKSNSRKNFCCKSCAATYSNTHKKVGTKMSKLEVWIRKELELLFPSLEIHFNKKDTINSELDIYIPSLRLAFELNGIFHYEPIYGAEKLKQIENNDSRKLQACLERGIEMCIIDVSSQKYFKESTSKVYLNIILKILAMKNMFPAGTIVEVS